MVTSGFFNAKNHDRLYDAEQMSSIFDGIIRDGVLMHYGGQMMVKAAQFMTVNVQTGRAWFNHTWTLNNSILPLTLDPSAVNQNRTDAIVLDINAGTEVRKNTIKIVKGLTSVGTPARPTLIKDPVKKHWQYPLAYVYVAAGATAINQGNITNMVGLGDCPFVTAPLEKMNIDDLVAQWTSQWNTMITNYGKEWDRFMHQAEVWNQDFMNSMDKWREDIKDDTDTWILQFELNANNWLNGFKTDVTDWFNKIKDMFNEDNYTYILNHLATAEQNIEKLQQALDKLKGDTSKSVADLEKLIGSTKKELNDTIAENKKETDKAISDVDKRVDDSLKTVYAYIRSSISTHDYYLPNNLGTVVTEDQIKQISGHLSVVGAESVTLGSYWTSNFTMRDGSDYYDLYVQVKWRIIDFDYFSSFTSDSNFHYYKPHAVIMPSVGLSRMSVLEGLPDKARTEHYFPDTTYGVSNVNYPGLLTKLNDTTYLAGSHDATSTAVYNEAINEAKKIFGDHLLRFWEFGMSTMNLNSNNMINAATNSDNRATAGIPSQSQLFGETILKNTPYGNNSGTVTYRINQRPQFKLFKMHPEILNQDLYESVNYGTGQSSNNSRFYHYLTYDAFSQERKPRMVYVQGVDYYTQNNIKTLRANNLTMNSLFLATPGTNMNIRPYFAIG